MSLLESRIPKSSNRSRSQTRLRKIVCADLAGNGARRCWQEVYSLRPAFNSNFPEKDKTINADESVLLRQLAQGETAAFWQLWENHRRVLYAICLRQMDGVQEEAEDALSRVMLRAWDKLPVYAARIENLKAWLIRLAFNLCADVHRERRRASSFESLDKITVTGLEPALGLSLSPEDFSIRSETSRCLYQAVGNLPLRLREPFVLRFFYEAAYAEIAEHLAVSSANVRKRIQQARVILREQLSHHIAGAAENNHGLLNS